MNRSVGRTVAGFYLAISLAVTYINLGSSIAIPNLSPADAPFFLVLALHALWGTVVLLSSTEYQRFSRGRIRRFYFVPEVLLAASLLLFLFSFIFALNANMDYVQRFVEGGSIRLAPDTSTERLLVWSRVFPLVALDAGVYLFLRIGRYKAAVVAASGYPGRHDTVLKPWALVLTLLSALLSTIAMPSFAGLDGFPLLGWVALVPLFLAVRSVRFGHGVFYFVTYGVFATLFTNYWLATFSLVSLQITVLIFLVYYLIFAPVSLAIYRVAGWARFLVFPLAFTLFEFLRSSGFLGYPWALVAHSQYSVVPLIQIAELTGVWGISFVVLIVNSALAELLGAFADLPGRHFLRRSGRPYRHLGYSVRQGFGVAASAVATVSTALLVGTIMLAVHASSSPETRTVRVAQIQQNNDPRKTNYAATFATLQELTARTLDQNPDIVFWSETAFVPNIRRWAQDTSSRRYHRLVNDFLDYQEELGRWLLTGNDDYEVVRDDDGEELERLRFNAAVLFDANGQRRETYRKIRLVPFTEHFPYRDTLPWVYNLLLDFDVSFWEQGAEMTVFEHPLMRFSTPICYEDAFPDYVRRFVLAGTEVLANISNDYWSLAEVQAKQHFVAGMFRAVENRRPVIRTTSSGLTGYVDELGRIQRTAPYFEEVAIITDIEIREDQPLTLYTRVGDYFPLAAGGALFLILAGVIVSRGRKTPSEPSQTPQAAAGSLPPTRPKATTPPPENRGQEPPKESPTKASAERNRTKKKHRGRKKKFDWRAIWDD